MKRHWVLSLIVANLAAIAVLAVALPRQMLSPGALGQGHAELAEDCFACHVPWHGSVADKCIGCHAVATIGLRTVKGLPLAQTQQKAQQKPQHRPPFHQALASPDCMGCHSEHAVPRLAPVAEFTFVHALLNQGISANCAGCHTAPLGDLHRSAGTACAQCHVQTGWKPATFDHARFFPLTGDHKAPCATCHVGNATSSYTCYGCHEHQPAGILAKHRRERIANIDNCVACHRGGHQTREEGRERSRTHERD